MVFFTGTTLGVEISFEPNSTTPAKFIVGYKRAEGLMDPVMEDAATGGKYAIKHPAHSVLAKIAGEIKSGGGATSPGLQGAQWFASGEAAEILAGHPATAAILTNDKDIAATAAKIAMLGKNLQSNTVARGFLSKMHDGLTAQGDPAGADDLAARKHVAQLNALAQKLMSPERLALSRHYSTNNAEPNLLEREDSPVSPIANPSFQDAIGLSGKWDASVAALQKRASILAADTLQVKVGDEADARAPTEVERAQAVKDLADYPPIASSFNLEMRQSPQVVEAAKYYASLFLE